ncbi:MAG: peroxiredoxin [Pseudomonadota bacterium]|nr:peroxiredoxin [Pseudomonadota bacterium]
MTRRCAAGAALLSLSLSAGAALPLGGAAPDFTLPAAMAGSVAPFSLAEALKRGPVVLYFFPAAFTAGCNIEAHTFAGRIAEFQRLGATVIGVSNDDVATIARFSQQECAGKFRVAADPDSTVIKAYDAKLPLIGRANRVSYLIGKDGRIRYEYSAMAPEGHIENTLKALKELAPAEPEHQP